MKSSGVASVVLLAVLLLSTCAPAAVTSATAKKDKKTCLALGFDKDIVSCELCGIFADVADPLRGLQAECLACCVAGDGDSGEDGASRGRRATYTSARIEMAGLSALLRSNVGSRLKTFVDTYGYAPYMEAVSLVDRYTVWSPRLVLVTAEGEEQIIDIDSWPPHVINDFLKKKLTLPDV